MIKRAFAWVVWQLVMLFPRNKYFHLEGYMERWWLRNHNDIRGRWPCRLHHILRSDDDRALHDHPWNYLTIILKGGYWEVTRVEANADWRANDEYFILEHNGDHLLIANWHGPGSILFRRADHAHRLILPEGETCWTLFFMGRWRQAWGFYTGAGKVNYKEYLAAE